ncbi:MAG TPA: hypothetical protein VNH11_03095 [Pirellulales bacterium]|nr:hypothetical protein [Pirellulales bacterium]
MSALGPLDAPALSTASVDLLRPSALGVSTHRRKKKSGALLWLIFGGTGITAVALLAILIILLVDMIGGGSANNPIAYLPSTYTLAASIRVRNLLDRAASVPQIKPQIDEALNNAVSQGFDPRDMQEVFIVIDGLDGYIAAKLSRPVGLSSLPGISSSGESHQGMPIYTMSNRKSANLPIGVSPSMQTMYYVTPSANLLIGATKSERLKEAIDRAKEGRGGRLDLPTGYDLVLRAKTHGVHQSHGGIIASFNRVHGYFVTLRWTDTLSFNADIDTQDAETANMLQQLLTTALQSSRTGLSQQPQAAAAAGILELVHASVSGSQLRVSGSIPTSQLALLPPPSIPAGR